MDDYSDARFNHKHFVADFVFMFSISVSVCVNGDEWRLWFLHLNIYCVHVFIKIL